MDAARRKEVMAELVGNGYSIKYLDSWPPKVTLYRHKPGLTMDGTVCFPVGSEIPNQPGHPDHVARKSRLGWLPWPPSETCKCRGCREGRGQRAYPPALEAAGNYLEQAKFTAEAPPAPQVQGPVLPEPAFSLPCKFCGFAAQSYKGPQGLPNKLKNHVKREHPQAAVAA